MNFVTAPQQLQFSPKIYWPLNLTIKRRLFESYFDSISYGVQPSKGTMFLPLFFPFQENDPNNDQCISLRFLVYILLNQQISHIIFLARRIHTVQFVLFVWLIMIQGYNSSVRTKPCQAGIAMQRNKLFQSLNYLIFPRHTLPNRDQIYMLFQKS